MKRHMLMMVALLVLATVVPASAQVPSDVPADHWAIQAIGDLYSRGIFVGYPDDSFRGDRAVTRYELAVVLSRLLESLPESAD
ncbi:MAG: S-layer homology domain-containing protein, partial [bacterium]|nr:S-layer homology domain-containing protein [bacterium]